jgi:hypothetical protein
MTQPIASQSLAMMLVTGGAIAATGPSVHVTPRTHLSSGQVVTVTGKGFAPGEQVFIGECNSMVITQGEEACSVDNDRNVVTTRKGLVPATTITLETGVIGVGGGTCGTSRADRKCYIGIANAGVSQSALTKIFFTVP